MIYLVFGDSITYGNWDLEGGWVGRLRKYLDHISINSNFERYYEIYNLGVSGDTSRGVLERFERETKVRFEKDEITLVFAIGINDSLFFNAEKHFKVTPEEFSENAKKIIEISREYTPRILFIGLTPVDEQKVDPIPWRPESSYKNEYIEKYNQLLKEICQVEKVVFINLLEKLGVDNFVDNLIDGVHPNSEGHQKIFEIAIKSLLSDSCL